MVAFSSPAFAEPPEPPPRLPFHLSPDERLQFSAEQGQLSGAYLALAQRQAMRNALCAGVGAPRQCEAQASRLDKQKRAYDAALDSFALRLRDRQNAYPGEGRWTELEP